MKNEMKKFKLKKNIVNLISDLIHVKSVESLAKVSIISSVSISVACLTNGLTRVSVWEVVYNSTRTLQRGSIRRIFKNDLQKNFKRKKNK